MQGSGNDKVLNTEPGKGISIDDLALMICKEPAKVQYVQHPHPHQEIKRVVCNNSKAI